ncbi:MAG: hypothetical protein HYW78_04140 [Parcubacteria group bacterium]|nr:hypothetical protein [Parcubacteria group bacterium]
MLFSRKKIILFIFFGIILIAGGVVFAQSRPARDPCPYDPTNTCQNQLIPGGGLSIGGGQSLGGVEGSAEESALSEESSAQEEKDFIPSEPQTSPGVQLVELKQAGSVDLLTEFSLCPPQGAKYATVNNCVIDTGFRQAIEEHLTIKRAIEKGYLHGDWFVGAPTRDTVDGVADYTTRYSLSNIKKLRRARVVPLGLEIAARRIGNDPLIRGTDKVKLREIVNGFYQYGPDGKCGTIDDTSPFCNLVDPSWVLKLPPLRCELTAYSRSPQSPESKDRNETCVDTQDCVREDENGKCVAWGYCTRELNRWRFDGDACETQYESCGKYTRLKDDKKFFYLANSLDSAQCDQDSSGCQWLCQEYDKDITTGAWKCKKPGLSISNVTTVANIMEVWKEEGPIDKPPLEECGNDLCELREGKGGSSECRRDCFNYSVTSTETVANTTTNPLNAKFFNARAELCKPTAEGCTWFSREKSGLGTNLARNPELNDWVDANRDGVVGANEVKGWQTIGSGVSFSATSTANGENVNVFISASGSGIRPEDPIVLPVGTYTISFDAKNSDINNHTISLRGADYAGSGVVVVSTIIASQSDWQRYSLSFAHPFNSFSDLNNSEDLQIFISDVFSGSGALSIDNIQFEAGTRATPFKKYGFANSAYLRKAPEWMKCYDGSSDNDSPECEKYLTQCSYQQVGCDAYYDQNFPDKKIPAIVTDNDQCPSECVGLETFKEMPSNFNKGRDLLNFIPKSAESCSANAVGCSEFTNLSEVAKGGEGREYYTQIRQCVKLDATGAIVPPPVNPVGATCKNYYTWVGSDTSGYQLKRYYLSENSASGGPKTVPNPRVDLGNCASHDDALVNPNCKEFYDSKGGIYYRVFENTISCSADCSAYRKTEPAIYDLPTTTCVSINGVMNNGACEKINFMAIAAQGKTCSASAVGCEKYQGNAGANVRTILYDNFENGSFVPYSGNTIEMSTESIYFGGHSIMVLRTGSAPYVATITRPIGSLVRRERSYALSAWINVPDPVSTNIAATAFIGGIRWGAPVTGAIGWQKIDFGTFYLNRDFDQNSELTIRVEYFGGGTPTVFFDNIFLQEVNQNFYLISDTWNTPDSCKPEPNFLGCRSYTNRAKQTKTLKSFTNLCSEQKVGCEAFINTQNTLTPFSESVDKGLYNNAPLTIATDTIEYYVYTPEKNDFKAKQCTALNMGCSRFGMPSLGSNGEATTYRNVYVKDTPNRYRDNSILCGSEKTGCQTFEDSSGGKVYFKDPVKTCEYKTNIAVVLNGVTSAKISGWFKRGTEEACDFENNPVSPSYTWGNESTKYAAAVCPSSKEKCSLFEVPDPTDPDNLSKLNRQKYYYLNNARLKRGECQGKVSAAEDCVLVIDTSLKDIESNVVKYYKTAATYQKSKNATPPYSLIDPVALQPGEMSNLNDANVIFQARKDRTCGEWIACTAYEQVYDLNGQYRNKCVSISQGRRGYFENDPNNLVLVIHATSSASALHQQEYIKRDVTFTGLDYSGYSLMNIKPIESLYQRTSDRRLFSYGDGSIGISSLGLDLATTTPQICKAFPEKDSPFKQIIGGSVEEGGLGYVNVNVCNSTSTSLEQCQCNYKKVAVGQSQIFYLNDNESSNRFRAKTCINGRPDMVGRPCSTDGDCGIDLSNNPGKCEVSAFIDLKEKIYRGQKGYCLEYDTSRNGEIAECITWLPTGAAAPICGNDIIEPGEDCDDSSASCPRFNVARSCKQNVCSNGIVEAYEQCDDGDLLDPEGSAGAPLKYQGGGSCYTYPRTAGGPCGNAPDPNWDPQNERYID